MEDDKPKELATKIDVYDDIAEDILPRNRPKIGEAIYQRRGTGGTGTANRLRIVQAYLLDQFNIPYNSFAKDIKPNHKEVEINFDHVDNHLEDKKIKGITKKKTIDLNEIKQKRKRTEDDNEDEDALFEEFKQMKRRKQKPITVDEDEDPEMQAETHSKQKSKPVTFTTNKTPITKKVKKPMQVEYDTEEEETTPVRPKPNTMKTSTPALSKSPASSIIKTPRLQTPLQSTALSSSLVRSLSKQIHQKKIRKSLFQSQNLDQSMGTPPGSSETSKSAEDSEDESEEEETEEDNSFKIDDVLFGGEVKSLHSGKTTNVIIWELEKTEKGCYRAKVGDFENMSTNIFIDNNFEKAEEELIGKISVIEITDLDIFNKIVVLIHNWNFLGPGPSNLGSLHHVGDRYLRSLRPGQGVLTPSRMKLKKW